MAWFEELVPIVSDEVSLTLSAPSSVVKQRLEERFQNDLNAALSDAQGSPAKVIVEVRVVDATTAPGFAAGSSGGFGMNAASANAQLDRSVPPPPPRHGEPARLDPEFTFDAFVIGESNSFAHAAARAVAENPGRAYNPLFVYGESGLGKTHLLHAIGNYVRQNFPHRHVRYVTTETFMNEFVDAIRTNTTIAIKRRYRESDVLLIDDIQFIESKEGLQEEFFHTFNDLTGARKQV
ncbi:MAG: chromosomal replication initiator protein, partial [Actinomycetota bacterium]